MNTSADSSTTHLIHYPVLLREVIDYIKPKMQGRYLDCTFGAGGYSRAILSSASCAVVAFDQDPRVQPLAESLKNQFGDNFHFIQENFANADQLLKNQQFDGILMDLGMSSMQVDNSEYGFSFMKNGPLDMRMSKSGISAEDLIHEASEQEIADIIYQYGQEHKARVIARNIVQVRRIERIDTTFKLADIVRGCFKYGRGKIDPATKTFQAIRIFINKELESLKQFLNSVRCLIKPEGLIAVVSFHSLEDSIVKSFFKSHALPKIAQSRYKVKSQVVNSDYWLRIVTTKPITPLREEILRNPRSRSAKLRIAQKLGG
jgi:16S rRNA (cytosine1402-N4)-methyltransferase